jgi:AcrR family transcriptional regulator
MKLKNLTKFRKYGIIFMTNQSVINVMRKISQKSKEHKELRRKEILEAATKVFSKKGFHRATLSEIAKQAGVSKATLYLYAKDKQSLIFLIADEATTMVLNRINELVEKISNPLEKLQKIIEIQFEIISEYRDMARILLSELPDLKKIVEDKIMGKRHKFIKILKRILEDGIKIGKIKEDIDIDLAVYILIGMSHFWTFEWISGKKLPTKKTINNFLNIYLYGIAKRRK